MTRKLFAALLALALLTGGLSALADLSSLSGLFIPSRLCDKWNAAKDLVVDAFYENLYGDALDDVLLAEKALMSGKLTVSYDEESDGAIYYANADWNVACSVLSMTTSRPARRPSATHRPPQ